MLHAYQYIEVSHITNANSIPSPEKLKEIKTLDFYKNYKYYRQIVVFNIIFFQVSTDGVYWETIDKLAKTPFL